MSVDREAVEKEVADWLDDVADHTDSSHDHDLIATLAQSIRWGEHRGFGAAPVEKPLPPPMPGEDPPF